MKKMEGLQRNGEGWRATAKGNWGVFEEKAVQQVRKNEVKWKPEVEAWNLTPDDRAQEKKSQVEPPGVTGVTPTST